MRKKYVDIEALTQGVDYNDISSILAKYEEMHLLSEEIKLFLKELEKDVRAYLRERKWTDYHDEKTGIGVNIGSVEDQEVDEKMLRVLLNDEQVAKVLTKVKQDTMSIITKDKLERLKKYGKDKKK